MLKVIVPLDFSQTSFNAARYAANMFNGMPNVTIILYHYYASGEDIQTARNYLNSQKQEFSSLLNNIEIELESGNNFIDSLAAFAHVKGAFMIVMGLTGKTPREQRFSGSNTLKLSEKEICPVLIVPDDAVYKGISNALISSELKGVEETPTLLAIKKVLNLFKPSLHVLNIDPSHYIALTKDFKTERDKMEVILAEFNPEFYFMRLFDFHESLDVFARDKNIDLIIIAPRYHNFYERLFKTQHTKKLIYQSKVPVLTIHE